MGKWIPVSRRLPEESGWYLTTIGDYNVMLKWYSSFHGWEFAEDNILAWMPLPEPYDAESEDKNENN